MPYPEPEYRGDTGELSAVLRRAAQPYDPEIGNGGTQAHYLATGATTNGEFGLHRSDFTGPRSGDPHFHKTIPGSFYMLSGPGRSCWGYLDDRDQAGLADQGELEHL